MSLNLDKSAWRHVAFGDVVRNVNETVKDAESAGIDRVIAMEHLDPGELKVERWGSVADGTTFTRKVKPCQTLFGKRRAYQRKVAYAEFEAICSGDIYTFEADDAHMLGELLPFLVQSNKFFDHALDTSAGSLSPRTNWRDLANFEFDLPPLDEQKRIADFLWAIESHEQGLHKMESENRISRSVWFGEILRHGVAERGWTRRPVPSLVLSGPTNGKSARANDEQRGVPTLSLSAIRDGRVLGGSSVKYMDVPPSDVANFVIEHDDFLVVRGNGNKQLTGKGGLAAGGLPEGCIYPDLLMRLRFDPSTIHPAFAAEQWNSSSAHSELIQRAKSTNGIWKINGQDIKAHQLVVPPLSTQLELLEQLETFESASAVVNAEAAVLRSIRSSVLTEIFGGN